MTKIIKPENMLIDNGSFWSIQWKQTTDSHPRLDECFKTKQEVLATAAGIAIDHTLADFQHLSKVHHSFVKELIESFEKNNFEEVVELWNNVLRSSGESELLIREIKFQISSLENLKVKANQKIEALKEKLA